MEMHDKMAAFIAPLAKFLSAPLKTTAKYIAKHPIGGSIDVGMAGGIPAFIFGSSAMKGNADALATFGADSGASMRSPFARAILNKRGSADNDAMARMYDDVTTYLSNMHPSQSVKYAMMMLCGDDKFLKMSRIDHQAATFGAMSKVAEILSGLDDVDDDSLAPKEKEDVAKVVEFKKVDPKVIKKAMVVLRSTFPKLYEDSNAKIAFIAYVTRPDVMVKTSYFQTAPSSIARFGLPIAAVASLASAVLGVGAALKGGNDQFNKSTSYSKLTEVDPELKNYPESHVKKVIYDLYKVAPDVMKNDTLASHIVHQVVASPPGGVSIDFSDKLLRAQEQLKPEYADRFVKVLGPTSQLVSKVLDVF